MHKCCPKCGQPLAGASKPQEKPAVAAKGGRDLMDEVLDEVEPMLDDGLAKKLGGKGVVIEISSGEPGEEEDEDELEGLV